MQEVLLNNIYGYLYRMYNSIHENVDTDGNTIWVDMSDGNTYAITINKCEKENDNG